MVIGAAHARRASCEAADSAELRLDTPVATDAQKVKFDAETGPTNLPSEEPDIMFHVDTPQAAETGKVTFTEQINLKS
jgi:hypothetical protein